MAKEMNGETLLCPIDKFLAHYGPCTGVKVADVRKCKKFLVKEKELDEKAGRWTKFSVNPSQQEGKDEVVFKQFEPIVDKIFEYTKAGRSNKYKIQIRGGGARMNLFMIPYKTINSSKICK